MARREWGSMAFFACLIALCAVAGISSQKPEKPPISESFAHRFLVDVQAGQYARVVNNRDIVNDTAIAEAIIVLTAEATAGPLRAVIYGEPDDTRTNVDETKESDTHALAV